MFDLAEPWPTGHGLDQTERQEIMEQLSLCLSALITLAFVRTTSEAGCPPNPYGSCPSTLVNPLCVFYPEMAIDCISGPLDPECVCKSSACTGDSFWSPLLQGPSNMFVTGGDPRPEGCCAEITPGTCFTRSTRDCALLMICRNASGGSICETSQNCAYCYNQIVEITAHWFTNIGCCVDEV